MAYESATFEQESGTLKEKAQRAVQQVRERGGETLESTVDVIRGNPGKTVAIAVVLGGILGAVIVNAMTEKEEPAYSWDRLQEISAEALEKLKDRAAGMLCSARDMFDTAAKRFS